MGDVVNTETEVIRINSSELNSYQYEFWKEDFDTNGYWDLNKEDVMDLMEMVRMKQLFIDKFNKELVTKKQPSITDVKVQIRALVRSKIHRGDQDDFLKEVNELLKELE
jgi:adenylate cyclase class IV